MGLFFLQRHGDAGDDILDDPAADAARPLTPDGRSQALWIGLLMQERGYKPSLILSSALPRAAETAALVNSVLRVPMQILPELDPHLNVLAILDKLTRDDDFDGVHIIGHHDNLDPAIAGLSGVYIDPTGQYGPKPAAMSKGELRVMKRKSDGSVRELGRYRPTVDEMTVYVDARPQF